MVGVVVYSRSQSTVSQSNIVEEVEVLVEVHGHLVHSVERSRQSSRNLITDVGGNVCTQRVAVSLQVVSLQQRSVVGELTTDEVVGLLRTTTQRYIVSVVELELVHNCLIPVGINVTGITVLVVSDEVVAVLDRLTRVGQHLVTDVHIGNDVNLLGHSSRNTKRQVSRVVNGRTASGTLLGSYKNNTVLRTNTVNRSRSILQHRDTLDIVGVHLSQQCGTRIRETTPVGITTRSGTNHTVDNHHRLTITTHTHTRVVVTGHTRLLTNQQTGNLTLQRCDNVSLTGRNDILSRDIRNRRSKRLLLLSTETYNDNILNDFRILNEGYSQRCAVVYGNLLSYITDERYLDGSVGCYVAEFHNTINVRVITSGGTFHHNTRTDYGTISIGHRYGQIASLCIGSLSVQSYEGCQTYEKHYFV